MLDEVSKVLGPWPILQFMFAVAVLGFGVYMIVRGISNKKSEPIIQLEDKRAEWLAYEHLKNIEENSFKMVELQKQHNEQAKYLAEQIKALAAAIWNRGV